MIAGAAGLADNLGTYPNMSPKRFEISSEKAPTWPPGGLRAASKWLWEASGRPLASLGALGCPRPMFERFGEPFGVPFKSPKIDVLKMKLKSNMAFDAQLELSGGPLDHFLGQFWKYCRVLFEAPPGSRVRKHFF